MIASWWDVDDLAAAARRIDQASVVASVKTHAWQGVRLWKDGGQAIQKSRC